MDCQEHTLGYGMFHALHIRPFGVVGLRNGGKTVCIAGDKTAI